MSFFLERMMETKNGNSKNIKVGAYKEQLFITLFSNLVFKHENIRLLIEYYSVSNHVACFESCNRMLLM